ncbi:MAG: hypothetical protein ABJN40_07440 [Sneathiella sp.]
MSKTPDHRITIRLKPEEYALLKAKAGNKPLSVFLRELSLTNAAKRRSVSKPAPINDHKALAQILALLGQHELVEAFKKTDQHIANGSVYSDKETKLLLDECKYFLKRIHQLLIRSLGGSDK